VSKDRLETRQTREALRAHRLAALNVTLEDEEWVAANKVLAEAKEAELTALRAKYTEIRLDIVRAEEKLKVTTGQTDANDGYDDGALRRAEEEVANLRSTVNQRLAAAEDRHLQLSKQVESACAAAFGEGESSGFRSSVTVANLTLGHLLSILDQREAFNVDQTEEKHAVADAVRADRIAELRERKRAAKEEFTGLDEAILAEVEQERKKINKLMKTMKRITERQLRLNPATSDASCQVSLLAEELQVKALLWNSVQTKIQ